MHYVLYYGNLYCQLVYKLYKDEGLIKKSVNLKSIKFLIICVDTKQLSTKASRSSRN